MSEFGSEVSGSEVSSDSGTTSEISEVKTGSEVSESEMDDDLSNELDDSYDSYMEEGQRKTFESGFNENEEVEESEFDETDGRTSDDLDSDLDSKYDSYIEDKELSSFEKGKATDVNESGSETEDIDSEAEHGKQHIDNAESLPEKIKCRNEDLEGQKHQETGVPFERKQVEVDGKQYEVVVPEFESSFEAQLPENMYEATDREQFKECNSQLKNEVATNKDFREQFDDDQLEQIENGDTPDGYTWHHDAEAGKMQLVDTETHQKTGHTGGRSIWGGGTDNR